jgi:DNA modification methylase
MDYYCRYKPNSVLDFTMGWGGRLIGASALNIPNYIGIDMNTNLIKPYEEMVKMIKPYTSTKIKLMFKNALNVDYNKLDYDMVFTSPPYYNIEKYSHMQDIKTKEEWNKTFYEPIINKTWNGLKKGGHYCLNIPIEVYDNVCIKILGEADKKIPIIKAKRKKGGGENYKEYTYIWKKK